MIVAAAVAANDQSYEPNGVGQIPFQTLLLPPILQAQNVTFTVNFSKVTAWIPNRPSLRKLSAALKDHDRTITSSPNDSAPLENYPDSDLFTRSLQSRLFRHGPILGQTNLCFVVGGKGKDWKSLNVAENRADRCYQPPGDSA